MDDLQFDYQDAKGNVSTRTLRSWNDDGWLLKGYCTSDQAPRTFRRDRIIVVNQGGDLLKPIQMPCHIAERRAISSRKQQSVALEILFTGFPKSRRAELEAAADDVGMQLRKTVTQALAFVCAGPNAGPTKLRKAQGQGVAVLDESDFLWLLETGEMPE
ncbi:hypothetical protein [Chromohalobacter nigrandesensis]|uniref:WYL domain-containing protein n=1 Tax=Chromohalobacter nigrandesensis TaxID=119863 RepID=UPI001FF49D03|nr:hypothetical protein [Chromohalobacter nigrandesensis]MCK0746756.1 hypothetical protein [Chromohalobacter nigrandesensis]